jgi:hypothetical protein
MMRYAMEGNRRIRQVRTVVWEDGAVRPPYPIQPAVPAYLRSSTLIGGSYLSSSKPGTFE